jgi:hypothetical protein
MTHADRFPTFRATARLLSSLFRWTWPIVRPILAVLVVLGLAAYVVTNVTAGRELERELSLIRQRGEPLTLAEAAPPPVPNDENAALVYEQAYQRLPRRVEYAPRVATLREQRLAQQDEKTLSDFFSAKPERRGGVTMAQVRQTLAGTEDALALARQAAAMPRCRFPVDWEAGAGALFPHYPKLRSLARLLAAHAVVSAEDGRTREAVADLKAVVGLARHCGEPVLIGQLVQYACMSFGTDALRRVLDVSSLDEEEARQLAQALADVELYAPFERALMTERAFGLWGFDLWRRDPRQLLLMVQGDEDAWPIFPVRVVQMVLRCEPVLKKDQIFYLRYMAENVALARQHRHIPQPGLPSDEGDIPLYATISRIITPVYSSVHNKRDETIARLGLAQWALALHVYRQQNGRYPENLQEADALLDRGLPGDPFSEQPFVYRREGGGYLLYSVGVNGRDDNGGNDRLEPRPATLNQEIAPRIVEERDDVAWRVVR